MRTPSFALCSSARPAAESAPAQSSRQNYFPARYGSKVDSQERPLREKVTGMVKMLGNPRMLLLLPMMFFTGLNNTFYAAWFTRQILSCHTGLVLLALGAGEMLGAYVAGGVFQPRVHVS